MKISKFCRKQYLFIYCQEEGQILARSRHIDFSMVNTKFHSHKLKLADIFLEKTHLHIIFGRSVVKDPTRGQNILNLVQTNLHKYYKQPEILPPIGSSDHNVILLPSKTMKPKGIKSRILIHATPIDNCFLIN